MIKVAYVDIGELGYSLYLSAHLRWLKENTNHSLAIITSSDRKCLYKNLADLILDVPGDFYERFIGKQNCFGIGYPMLNGLREYFQKMLPFSYMIPEGFNFDGNCGFLLNKTIYKPYTYNKKLEGKKKILIFPRYRNYPPFSRRNLPELFYVKLIEALCNEFHDHEIKTIGLTSGSYNIEVDKDNYKNGVKEKVDLQDVIDECQLTTAAIGGTSSLPKISLLQKVPTFIIGHEKKRFTIDDNWLKTKARFYEIRIDSYSQFDFEDCMNKIILFIKEKKMEKAKIKLTEETVQIYWKNRTASDGIRAVEHAGYSLVEQNKRHAKRKRFIFNHCPRNLKTLDYGCGIGRFAGGFKCYLGVDFTDPLLDIAKMKHPKANFLLLNSPCIDCELDFDPELIFTSCVLQHNPDDVVLKIFESFVPIVKSDIMFGLYENIEAQSGHMRGRTGKEYVEMIRKFFKVHEWQSHTHRMAEEHAFTLIKAGRK